MSVYGGNIPASFTTAYTAPSGTSLALDFQTDLTQRIFADSLDSHISGATTVDNKAQGCTAVGIEAPSLSTQKIELKTRYITTYSWADSRVADPRATNAQKAIAVGFDALSIPTHKIVISFYRAPSGTALAFNFTDAYTPVSGSAVPAEFSRTISFWPISPSGIEAPSVGAPDIDHVAYSTQVVYPSSVPLSYQWGTLSIILNSRFVNPSGLAPTLSFGTTTIEYKTKVVSPAGVPALSVGQASVSHWVQSLGVAGFTGGAVAAPVIYNTALGIFAPSLPEQVFGTTSVENKNKNPIPAGFDASAFGTQWISNKTRVLLAQGSNGELFGTTWVSNKTRNVLAEQFNATAFGDQWVSRWVRTFREIGWEATTFGAAKVIGKIQEAAAAGWNSHESGLNRISLAVQTVKTGLYTATLYGRPRVENFIRQLSLTGFSPTLYGTAKVELFNRSVQTISVRLRPIPAPNVRSRLTSEQQGFDALKVGAPSLNAETQYAPITGFVSDEFGSTLVTFVTRSKKVWASGKQHETFGTTAIKRASFFVTGAGCDSTMFFGNLRVKTKSYAYGDQHASFGHPVVTPPNQRITPIGIGVELLTTPRISTVIQRVFAPSMEQIIYGLPAISNVIAYSPYETEPVGDTYFIKVVTNNTTVHNCIDRQFVFSRNLQ